MTDIVSPKVRSRMMSGIRSKDTKPELTVRRHLHRKGLRYRLHEKLPGKPDLVFPKHRTVVFVHGCFWHRHEGCKYATTPKSNADFWQEKFSANVRRDAQAQRALEAQGWRVLTVWECQTTKEDLDALAATIRGE